MNKDYWCRPRHYDTSALVRLVADDPDEQPGRESLRKDYWQHAASVYATSHSVAETLSAFKRKWVRGRIDQNQYLCYIRDFNINLLGLNLRIDELPILSAVVRSEADRLVKTHNIDFLDCLQIITLKHGRHRVFGLNSQPILITTDRGLAKAARAEGVSVWECSAEPRPPSATAPEDLE